MLWKVCITWATLLRQIHWTFTAAIRTTVRHTCKGKAVEKCNFVIVISSFQGSSATTPTPTKIIVAVLYSSLRGGGVRGMRAIRGMGWHRAREREAAHEREGGGKEDTKQLVCPNHITFWLLSIIRGEQF